MLYYVLLIRLVGFQNLTKNLMFLLMKESIDLLYSDDKLKPRNCDMTAIRG